MITAWWFLHACSMFQFAIKTGLQKESQASVISALCEAKTPVVLQDQSIACCPLEGIHVWRDCPDDALRYLPQTLPIRRVAHEDTKGFKERELLGVFEKLGVCTTFYTPKVKVTVHLEADAGMFL